MKINGKQIAKDVLTKLKKEVVKKSSKPHLLIIIIGNNKASLAYVKQKEIKAKEIGIKTTVISLDNKTTEEKLISLINKYNNDKSVHGIIIQKPFPSSINSKKINLVINPQKDIDNLNSNSSFAYPIGMAVLEVLKKILKDLDKLKIKKIVIIGKGETGGKPIIETFHKLKLEPIIIDSGTKNPSKITKTADIIISAVGKKEIIKPNMLKKNCILIGAGQHKEANGKFHGDYNEEKIKKIASFYTTTPGGIGPINVAMILKNLIKAFNNQLFNN